MTRLERIAVELAQDASGLTDGVLPVAILDLADSLDIEAFLELTHPAIDGYAWFTSDGTGHILANTHPSKPRNRINFTLAHELSHILIAREIRFTSNYFFDCPTMARSPLDRACDLFAAELLMPEGTIRKWWDELSGNQQYRMEIIAGRFEVSRLALQVRVRELGLQTRRIP
jgi:Zn-dependent peptidase ImmA (M78 family)